MASPEEHYNLSDEEKGLLRVKEINNGIVLPMVIKTAIELDLFEIMAKTPGGQFSCHDLASSLPRQNQQTPMLIERILRFLAGESVLTSTYVEDEHGECKMLYGMTAVSNNYVRDPDGTSHASNLFLFLYDKVFVDCWYHLKDAVVEGGTPFNKAHGMSVFEYPAKDNRFNEVFNKFMHGKTRKAMKMVLEKYKGFEGVKDLVDVGGGLGVNLELIVSKYPEIKGINFDLPHVIKDAPPYPGVEHVGGDMFKSVPKGDVIFMKWILHDWGDNYCIKLLKNCWAALPECGKLVVVEAVIPDPESGTSYTDGVSKTAIRLDMVMLIAFPGGKERTIKEYNALAKQAGFSSMKIVCELYGGIDVLYILEMDVQEVNKKLLDELEEMGFPLARSIRALHSSGNSNLEDAINWIVDHEDEPEIDQMSSVPLQIEVEDFEADSMSEEVKLKAQKLRGKTCKRNNADDKKMEHGRVKERIRAQKELQEAKQVAEENERKRFIALWKAEKQEEYRAREKVRQKLNQDKVERRGKLGVHPQELNHASLKTTTPMVQENKEMLPIVSTWIRVDSTTKVDLMRDCLRLLKRNNKDDDIRVRKAFETLLIYVRNVARDPNEEKFRKIKMNNPAFKERVGTFEQGIKFLELCGFEKVEGGKYLFLPRERFDMAVFRSAGNELQSAITNPFFGLLSIEV